MFPDIIIPSIKTADDLSAMVCDLEGFSIGCNVILALSDGSAAHNRNAGLNRAKSDIVIMLDDDINGFYDGWWEELIRPLSEEEDVVYVSARLINPDGTCGAMMYPGDIRPPICDVPRIPTAAVAMKNDGLRFNEGFVGSGFEDDDFCAKIRHKYPDGRVVINNRVRLIHHNEQKRQHEHYEENKKLHDSIWQTSPDGKTRTLINAKTVEVEAVEPVLPDYGIPKIIHFVWVGMPMPGWVEENIAEFARLNPDHEIAVHDESDLGPFKRLADAMTGEHILERISDLVRVNVLKECGGWYFDTDFWPLMPIDEIVKKYDLKDRLFLTEAEGHWKTGLIANGVMATKAGGAGINLVCAHINYMADKYVWQAGGLEHPITRDWGAWGPVATTECFSCGSAAGVLTESEGPAAKTTGRKDMVVIGEESLFYPYRSDDRKKAAETVESLKRREYNVVPAGAFMIHLHARGVTVFDDIKKIALSQYGGGKIANYLNSRIDMEIEEEQRGNNQKRKNTTAQNKAVRKKSTDSK